MAYEIITMQIGHPRYAELIGTVRADTALMAEIWADSESRMPESPGKLWTVAAISGQAAAWTAAEEVDGVLRCSDSYERRGPGRQLGLYQLVHAHQHETIIEPSGLPAVTYVFAQPRSLYEACGWRVTDEGPSPDIAGHYWYEMRRP